MRNKLLLLGVCALMCAALAANAWADKSGPPEKPWNPIPQGTYADVNESEPNDSFATANPISCGDIYHAEITPAGDNDYIVFTTSDVSSITFATDAEGASPVGDTVIYLYDASFNQVGYDDDGGPGTYSLITLANAPAGTYYGQIYGYSTHVGTYKALVTCEAPPENDTCAGAFEIPCGTFDLAGTTVGAVNDYSPLYGGCTGYTAAGPDLVYTFTILAGTVFTATYTSTADGSFYIITDCSDPANSCVVGADGTFTGEPETIDSFEFTAPGTYYLILDSYGAAGDWTLTGDLHCPVVPTQPTSWGSIKNVYK
jgi:hypothetical protein